jgi:hypothetical protein
MGLIQGGLLQSRESQNLSVVCCTEAAAEECQNSFFFFFFSSGSCRQLLRLSSRAVKFISQVAGTAQEKELVVFF